MKKSNIIIIGGTIASGKSTLAEELAKVKKWNIVPESNDDGLQDIIWKSQYEHNRLHNLVIEYYYLTNREKKYQKFATNSKTSIFDRSIFESIIFTTLLMKENKAKYYEVFKNFWQEKSEKLIEEYGSPIAYIFLKINWEDFKKRIYKRGRKAEVENFSKNEDYFRNLLKYYNDNFANLIKSFGIPLITIDTSNLSPDQVLQLTNEEIKKLK